MSKYNDIMRFKWLANDASNWNEVLECMKMREKEIKYLQEMGCVIEDNTNDDYIFYSIPEDKIDEYCRTYGVSKEDLCWEEDENLDE